MANITNILGENFFNHCMHIAQEIFPVFLLALFGAALIDEFVPDSFLEKFFKKFSIFSLVTASFLGALIPMCTCGMIPLAYKLCKKGLDWKIIVAFLSAGNACSFTALWLTSVMGMEMVILRFAAAVFFGVSVSALLYLISMLMRDKDYSPALLDFSNFDTSCGTGCHSHGELRGSDDSSLPAWQRTKKIFLDVAQMIKSFLPWLLLAIVIASYFAQNFSLINQIETIQFISSDVFIGPLLTSFIGFPFYFCAGTDIPISQTLLSNGFLTGTVLSFMTASPGVNFTSFVVYKQCVGFKKALILIGASILVSILLGVSVNIF